MAIDLNKSFLGFIEDIDDPKKEGFARIRVPVLHREIKIEDLPWAKPKTAIFFGSDAKGGNISIPRIGALVEVNFDRGNLYNPEYSIIQELSDEVKEILATDGEYENCHIMLMDGQEELRIYYTTSKGVTIDLKGSRINIANNNIITIEHKGLDSSIELDGGIVTHTANSQINSTAGSRIKDDAPEIWLDGDLVKFGGKPQWSVVRGEKLFLLLDLMATAIDGKTPSSPNLMIAAVERFKEMTLSNTVKTT